MTTLKMATGSILGVAIVVASHANPPPPTGPWYQSALNSAANALAKYETAMDERDVAQTHLGAAGTRATTLMAAVDAAITAGQFSQEELQALAMKCNYLSQALGVATSDFQSGHDKIFQGDTSWQAATALFGQGQYQGATTVYNQAAQAYSAARIHYSNCIHSCGLAQEKMNEIQAMLDD